MNVEYNSITPRVSATTFKGAALTNKTTRQMYARNSDMYQTETCKGYVVNAILLSSSN